MIFWICLLLTIILFFIAVVRQWDCLMYLPGGMLAFTVLIGLMGLKVEFGESYYTGYIYSVETKFDKAIGHIRLSQIAGEDNQPSFCVDKKDLDTLQQYVGKDIKVKVTQPAGFGWSITNCILPVTIEAVETE